MTIIPINQSILDTDSDRRVLLALETQLRDTENKLTAALQRVTQNTVECRPLNKTQQKTKNMSNKDPTKQPVVNPCAREG